MQEIQIASIDDIQTLEDFLVENATEEDRPLAQKYIKAMFSEDYRKPTFLLLKEDQKIIAAAAYSEEFFTIGLWGISWVCVKKEKRDQGFGTKIMQECMKQISKKAGKPVTVILNTYPNKTGLYDNLGFKKAGEDHEGGSLMIKYI